MPADELLEMGNGTHNGIEKFESTIWLVKINKDFRVLQKKLENALSVELDIA